MSDPVVPPQPDHLRIAEAEVAQGDLGVEPSEPSPGQPDPLEPAPTDPTLPSPIPPDPEVAIHPLEPPREAIELDGLESDLAAVEAALARIDDGTYGRCGVCNEPLDDDRLGVDPTASICARHLDLVGS